MKKAKKRLCPSYYLVVGFVNSVGLLWRSGRRFHILNTATGCCSSALWFREGIRLILSMSPAYRLLYMQIQPLLHSHSVLYQYAYKIESDSNYTVIKNYSSTTSVSFTPSTAGIYTVRVIAQDMKPSTAVKTFYVTVK